MELDGRIVKIQDIVAHTSQTKSLKIGPKSGRVMVTGGEDKKVNLWAIGKSEPILSLPGHASAVDSVSMDWAEELVVAGSSSGPIKLWDLEQAKVIRTLTSHKAAVTSLEFHPFGEFFASGSDDYTVKIWDVRRKGCIQTYHGHQDGIRCLRISPDGRWISTGDAAGCVKVWDMTAGKLLRSYNPVPSPTTSGSPSSIASISFNPAEFMMSATNTQGRVQFYDLQTFEGISTCDTSGVGQLKVTEFDPDGTCLLSIGTEGMEVWGYEPPTLLDHVPTHWGDVMDVKLLPDEGKMIVGTRDGNFVSVWAVDLGRVNPFVDDIAAGTGTLSKSNSMTFQQNVQPQQSLHQQSFKNLVLQPADTAPQASVPSSRSFTEAPRMEPNPDDRVSYQLDNLSLGSSAPRSTPPRSTSQRDVVLRELPTSRSRDDLRKFDDNIRNEALPEIDNTSQRERKFVGAADGNKPLGLELGSFIDNIHHRQPHPLTSFVPPSYTLAPPTRPTTEDELIATLGTRHTSFTTLLSNRLGTLRAIRSAWDEDNTKRSLEIASNVHDDSVMNDILKVINLKPSLLNLESASLIVGASKDMLGSQYEDFITTTCITIKYIMRAFGQLIVATLDVAQSAGGVDVSQEERLQRCAKCYSELVDVQKELQSLGKAGGRVGSVAREAKKEIDFHFGE